MWRRPISRRRRSVAVARGRRPVAGRRTTTIVARRWIAVAMGRVAVRRVAVGRWIASARWWIAVGRIGIWRWMIVGRSMWWWVFVPSRGTWGTWWISAMSRWRPTRPIRRWSLRRVGHRVSWHLRGTTWTWRWSAGSPGLRRRPRRPRVLPPARAASSPPRAAAAAAATATSPRRSTAPRRSWRIWRWIRITSWWRRWWRRLWRWLRRRGRRVQRQARLAGEGLAIRIELADGDMSFPALQPNDQLVPDGEVSMREPCPHLICSEGPELRAAAVQVEPF